LGTFLNAGDGPVQRALMRLIATLVELLPSSALLRPARTYLSQASPAISCGNCAVKEPADTASKQPVRARFSSTESDHAVPVGP
jgi:hypothetical protein